MEKFKTSVSVTKTMATEITGQLNSHHEEKVMAFAGNVNRQMETTNSELENQRTRLNVSFQSNRSLLVLLMQTRIEY